MLFQESQYDKTVATFENNGGYTLRLIARVGSPSNVQYFIVVEDPSGEHPVGYMASLDQFKEIGFLLTSFSKFAEEKIDVSGANEATLDVIFHGLTKKTVIVYALKHKIKVEFLRLALHYQKKYGVEL